MKFNLREFNRFYNTYNKRFTSFAYMYVRDMNLAEDLVQEAFAYYWEHKDSLSDDTNIPAYVMTSVKHYCIDYLRRKQLEQQAVKNIGALQIWELQTRLESLQEFEPDEIFTEEIKHIVNKALDTLPERSRYIFNRSRVECMSHKEIAEELGITTKGVEFHISKVTKVLRFVLKDYLYVVILFLNWFVNK